MARTTEWLNSNAYRVYPFVENQLIRMPYYTPGTTETFPNNFLLDFQVTSYAAPAAGVYMWWLARRMDDTLDVTFNLVAEGSVTEETDIPMTVTVPLTDPALPYRATVSTAGYYLAATFGEGLQEVADSLLPLTAPDGKSWYFADPGHPFWVTEGGRPWIEPALCVFQDKHRIDSVVAAGAGNDTLTGDIYCEEGYSCRIQVVPRLAQGRTMRSRVIIGAAYGAGAGVSCEVLGEAALVCNDALLRVNGLPGADDGQFGLVGGMGVEVIPEPANNRIIIRRRMDDASQLECEADK